MERKADRLKVFLFFYEEKPDYHGIDPLKEEEWGKNAVDIASSMGRTTHAFRGGTAGIYLEERREGAPVGFTGLCIAFLN